MTEEEKRVSLEELGEERIKSAFDSFETTKETISFYNQKYSFNLYNNADS